MPRQKHGGKGTREYISWLNMRQRCLNPKHPNYAKYGGRGVTVCRAWDDFAVFLADMGERPINTSLERKNNSKGYSKSNCVWATQTQQVRNRRNTHTLTAFGKTQSLAAWAEETGMLYTTLSWRIHHGWTLERAIKTPTGKQNGKS